MDGFKRPSRPARPTPSQGGAPPQPATRPTPGVVQPTIVAERIAGPTIAPGDLPPVDLAIDQHGGSLEPKAGRKKRLITRILLACIGVVVLVLVGGYMWYTQQLTAVDVNDDTVQRIEVKEGVSFGYIAERLEERGIIRSGFAFELYATLQGKRDAIKAGTCNLTPAESASAILAKLTEGCHDFKSITFYPGGTIEKPLFKPAGSTVSQELYVKNILAVAGYSDAQIAEALAADYSGPLFADKPKRTTLEGYIFGETYYVATDATAQEVLQATFDQMYKVVQQNDLVAKFAVQKLDLYQGITLASIVQKELNCEDKPTPERKDTCYGYQQKIASVFLNRLKVQMPLGSDSTFIYAADMLGKPATSSIDSPYNTYKHAGLPPGPIASPGELALRAVANPATTDYLYFVAGDDGLIHFARTQAEHEQNTRNYCHTACAY